MLYLDENIAKNNLTVNQYTKLCSAVDYRNNNIKEQYKSIVANSKLEAIQHFRHILQADSGLDVFPKMIKFSAKYILVEENGEFWPSNDMIICLDNFAKFSVYYDDFIDAVLGMLR
jgi:hypothetical protein